MTKFIFIRHGEADYKQIDERNFIGQGRALSPLTELGISQINETSKDLRLMNSDLILASPYTRALQSTAIISKELNLEIKVEVDLHEWIPDIVGFQYKTSEDCFELHRDFILHDGIHPEGTTKVWETKESMKRRMDSVLDRYMNYNQVIVVCHGMIIRTQKNQESIKNGEIIEIIRTSKNQQKVVING